MARPLLFASAAALLILSGCTLSAKAGPQVGPDSASTGATPITTAIARLSPEAAVSAQLQTAFGADGMALVSSVAADGQTALVTLAATPSTLGGAERFWSACAALTPLLGAGETASLAAVVIASVDGKPVVGASVESPACALVTSR